MIRPPIIVLHIDGVGEYAMKRERDGKRCLFVFTSKESAMKFVELMELPEHKAYTAISFESVPDAVTMLTEIRGGTQLIALDPEWNGEFTPIPIDDVIAALQQ